MTKLTKEQVKFFIETMTDYMYNTTQHEIAETLLSKFDECESLQEKLLAYEQAAKNPAAPAQPVIPEQPDAQDLELYIDMLENSDSDDQDGELNNTQLIMWLKELQRRRTLPAQPANGDKQ